MTQRSGSNSSDERSTVPRRKSVQFDLSATDGMMQRKNSEGAQYYGRQRRQQQDRRLSVQIDSPPSWLRGHCPLAAPHDNGKCSYTPFPEESSHSKESKANDNTTPLVFTSQRSTSSIEPCCTCSREFQATMREIAELALIDDD